jgi:glycosyltransferase involved in cell wall biosynthesis
LRVENNRPEKIAILLCTFHGQRYLEEQLDSFAAQTHKHWEVWASDDGSRDDTHSILEAYREKWGKEYLSIHSGPLEGFVANFLSLVCRADIAADYYAFSDQDDVWESDKLERALNWLRTNPDTVPALYCSRTRLVDAENNEIGLSPLFRKEPSFANALVQNIGGGNTMVFNNAARELLRKAGDGLAVPVHDWWAYIAISGCGGQIHYDQKATTRYRQHADNLIGMNNSWFARLARMRMLTEGRFKVWTDANLGALDKLYSHLTPENREIVEQFRNARRRRLIPRVLGLRRSGVRRQTFLANLSLIAAFLFNKI